jgi:hypothetical protein
MNSAGTAIRKTFRSLSMASLRDNDRYSPERSCQEVVKIR